MKTALIIGVDSVIGYALHKELVIAGWAVFGTTRRKECVKNNIIYLDLSTVVAFSFRHDVQTVFLCASITKVANCRDNEAYAKLINHDAQIILANYFLEYGVHVIFLSTHAVFSGQKPAYRIDEPLCPITVYGKHKAMVEQELQKMPGKISIVRLSKVLTGDYPLIIRWIKALCCCECIAPFYDLSLCPISLEIVTYCLKEIAERTLTGIIHLSGEKDVSYLDLATYLVDVLNVSRRLIVSCSAVNAGVLPAEMPLYASLDVGVSKRLFCLSDLSLVSVLKNIIVTHSICSQGL